MDIWTPGYPRAPWGPQGTSEYPGVPGTSGFHRVPQDTPGFPGVPLGYNGVPQGTPGYIGALSGAHVRAR